MKPILLAAAAALAFAASPAQAVKCAPAGSVSVFNTTGGYVFYISKTYGDAAFMIPGQAFSKDAGAPPGSTQFNVDQVHYQFLSVPKSKFVASVAASDDASILLRHARQEHQFAVNAGSQFTALEDLGNRKRAAAGPTPAFVFKLWTLKNPAKPDGASQLMLSTVIGDEVALLSAIVPSAAHKPRALAVFERFASSYRFVATEKECPKRPAAP
jgi:hypothetical protein